MKNTYELKTIETAGGVVEILEMITPEGVISTIPIDENNADYQRYLNAKDAN